MAIWELFSSKSLKLFEIKKILQHLGAKFCTKKNKWLSPLRQENNDNYNNNNEKGLNSITMLNLKMMQWLDL